MGTAAKKSIFPRNTKTYDQHRFLFSSSSPSFSRIEGAYKLTHRLQDREIAHQTSLVLGFSIDELNDSKNWPVVILQGYYFQPTVITGLGETSRCVTEEIFGPVVTISPFTDESDVIHKANAVTYGLCAAVWSKDVSRCLRVSRALKVISTTMILDSWTHRLRMWILDRPTALLREHQLLICDQK